MSRPVVDLIDLVALILALVGAIVLVVILFAPIVEKLWGPA